MMTVAAIGALAIGLGACKNNEAAVPANESMNVADEPGVANMGAADNGMSGAAMTDPTSDAGFATAAAASDMFEIQSSQKALATTKVPAIKAFAQMMVTEHTKSSAELKTLASGMNPPMTLPTTLPAEQQALLSSLDGKTGTEFDRAYLAAQRTGHQGTLTKVNAYVAAAKPGGLKDFASKMSGVVQKHLNMLDKIKV
jgi:putative membrane protein